MIFLCAKLKNIWFFLVPNIHQNHGDQSLVEMDRVIDAKLPTEVNKYYVIHDYTQEKLLDRHMRDSVSKTICTQRHKCLPYRQITETALHQL